MKKLMRNFKIEIRWKEVLIWFAGCFAVVLLIFTAAGTSALTTSRVIEALGFAAVFVLMILGTKSYSRFLDAYTRSFNKKTAGRKKVKRA